MGCRHVTGGCDCVTATDERAEELRRPAGSHERFIDRATGARAVA
jgi:hypothetical protein